MNIRAGLARRLHLVRHRRDWLPVHSRVTDGRAVALTFDDGPSRRTTRDVLRLLRAADTRAAFFLNGRRAERAPDLVDAMVAGGHQVFSHGYDHVRFAELSDRDIRSQLDRCEDVLRRHRPTPTPCFVRLPYGSGHGDARVHRALRAWRPDCAIAHWGYSLHDWTLADGCGDESALRRRCARAVDEALASRRLRGAVLLLHEDAFDVDAPLAPRIAPVLLATLLRRVVADGVALARGLGEASDRPGPGGRPPTHASRRTLIAAAVAGRLAA